MYVCTQSEEERNQTVLKTKKEEKISSLDLLPPNSLVYFIILFVGGKVHKITKGMDA